MNENGADDWLLWVAFLNYGGKFTLNDARLYIHVNDGHNTSNDNDKMIKSSFEALHIIEKNGDFEKKLLRVYCRRLNMRKAYLNGTKFDKMIIYLKNPDIAIRLIKYKRA